MMGFGFGGFGVVYMLIFGVVVVGVAVWLLSQLFSREEGDGSSRAVTRDNAVSESPLEILRRRYARGEISWAEYDEIRRELGG